MVATASEDGTVRLWALEGSEESDLVCQREMERERDSVCVCVCMCEYAFVGVGGQRAERLGVCACVHVSVCACARARVCSILITSACVCMCTLPVKTYTHTHIYPCIHTCTRTERQRSHDTLRREGLVPCVGFALGKTVVVGYGSRQYSRVGRLRKEDDVRCACSGMYVCVYIFKCTYVCIIVCGFYTVYLLRHIYYVFMCIYFYVYICVYNGMWVFVRCACSGTYVM